MGRLGTVVSQVSPHIKLVIIYSLFADKSCLEYIYKISERQVTPHATMSATVRKVVDGESLRISSREYKIPRSTLSRYVSVYKQDETAVLEANFKKAQIFNDEQEQLFVDYLINTIGINGGKNESH